jgi:hypothetical protein
MDKSGKTVVTIYENDYEFLELSKYVTEDKYFDTIYEMLVEKREVIYKDYIIKYKPRNQLNANQFITYDDNDLPIRFYTSMNELAQDFNVELQTAFSWFRGGKNEYTKDGELIVKIQKPEKDEKKRQQSYYQLRKQKRKNLESLGLA